MVRTVRLSLALTTAAIAALVLAGCTGSEAPMAAEETPAASAASPAVETESQVTPIPTPSATGCPTAEISFPTASSAELSGDIQDTGVRQYAAGEPTLNADGQIVSYTVESGDALEAIATRFCIEAESFGRYNKVTYWAMQPGDVLVFRPDPDATWAPQTDDEAAAVSCKAGYKNGIDMSDSPGRVMGWIADFGASTGANGTVQRNADGEIETYTVAAGDNLGAVADRFCFDTESLRTYNKTGQRLVVGDVLVLNPPFEG